MLRNGFSKQRFNRLRVHLKKWRKCLLLRSLETGYRWDPWVSLKELVALDFLDGRLFVWGSMFSIRLNLWLCWSPVVILQLSVTARVVSPLIIFSAPNMVCQMKLGTPGVCEIKREMNDWDIWGMIPLQKHRCLWQRWYISAVSLGLPSAVNGV